LLGKFAWIFGKSEFMDMKPTAFLINAARGGMINKEALMDAMNTGEIGGAGLDTVGLETLPEDSPLSDLPNTVITSQAAAFTDSLTQELPNFLIENALLIAVHRLERY
jgi:phosphoglycerate dehydrogenase-like enzyme